MKMMLATLLILALSAIAVGAAEVNVRDYGAKGDAEKDDSGAIQAALDAAVAQGGGRVYMPPGTYRMENSITVPTGVTLAGSWEAPHHGVLLTGTAMFVYAGKGNEEGEPLINLNPSSAISGITFYYPEQQVPNPFPYPWTIQGGGMHGSVMDVTFVNAYKCIDFGTKHHELHYIRNVFGCFLKKGIFIDQCTDIGRIENVHFNPHYWARAQADNKPDWNALRDHVFENAIAFEFGRSDWEYVFNTFSFGCKVGYRFFKSEKGACNGNFVGIAADWAETAVLIEQTQNPGLLITNGQFVGGAGASTAIEVKDSHTGVAQFHNCSFWGFHKQVAIINGKGAVNLSQCNFVDWQAGNYAVEANGGELTIQGCNFRRPQRQISMGPELMTAVIMGNQFRGEEQIENKCTGDVQMGLNAFRKEQPKP